MLYGFLYLLFAAFFLGGSALYWLKSAALKLAKDAADLESEENDDALDLQRNKVK
jgi:hypothetical protein